MEKLKGADIFDLIFGETYHIQLIQRSSEIIKLFINEKEIGEREIDIIWSATKKDQQTKMEIYKIISDIAIMFKNQEIEMLVDRFALVEPDQFVEKELECVYELSKYTYNQASFSVKALKLFWDIATRKRNYKKQVIEMAIEKFVELIRNQDREVKGKYVLKGIKNLQNNKQTLQSIKIIQKILEQIPNYRTTNQQTQNEVVNQLIKDFDIVNLVIFDIAHYDETMNDLWIKGVFNEKNIDTFEPFDLPFSHMNNVFTRLNFIRSLLQLSQTQLDEQQLDQIWDMLLISSKIPLDQDTFFNWLKQLLADQNKITVELQKHFFESKVCNPEVSFKIMKKACFDSIQQLFVVTNEFYDKMVILQMPTLSNQSAKVDFRIQVPPRELIGINILWKMLQQCDKKSMELSSLIIDLITKVYHNLASTIQDQVHEIEDQFCHESLMKIKAVIDDQSVSDDEKKNFAMIMTIMIRSFFEDSEKFGTGNMKPHLALDKDYYIQRLVIQNNITQQKDCPKYIEISTYSNMTVWELKKIVASKLKQSPLKIQLTRSDTKNKKAITDLDHAKTLEAMKVHDYEVIMASRKPIVIQPRVPLLNKKKDLVPEARAIFDSWFDKYSIILPETGIRIMTPKTCCDFIRDSTKDDTVQPSDSRIANLFTQYDTDNDEQLQREEFIQFYTDRAIQKPELVWSNLSQHNIGNDLRPVNSNQTNDDPREIKDESVLPRYKLSSNQDGFSAIFQMIQSTSSIAVQEELWNLVKQLRTNPVLFASILSMNNLEMLTQQNRNVFELHYCLQIIDYFMNEIEVQKPCEMKLYFCESQDYQVQYPSLIQNTESSSSNEFQRDKQHAAPESGRPIALPAAPSNVPEPPALRVPFIGPLPPGQENQRHDKGVGGDDFDIDIGDIGPDQPANNNAVIVNKDLQKINEMLGDFKGQVITEPIKQFIISHEELANYVGQDIENIEFVQKNWIQNFINVGGFKLLLELVENLQENQLTQEKDLNRMEKLCLAQIMNSIKVLLISSFISHSPYQIAQSKEEKKSAIQIELEETVAQCQPIITVLSGQLGESILNSINFERFQGLLLSLLSNLLQSKDIFGPTTKIFDHCLSLWITCIVYHPKLLEVIYQNYQSECKDKIICMLLEHGLMNARIAPKKKISEALLFICQNIKSDDLSEAPAFFLLKVMIKEMNLIDYKSKESQYYFSLLKTLMEMYFKEEDKHPLVIDKQLLIIEYVQRLEAYQSKERKAAFVEDQNLIGLLNLIELLIKNQNSLLTYEQLRELVKELIEKDLFAFNLQPMSSDVTKETNIVEYEKPYLNKCQSFNARDAAYQLLITICEQNDGIIYDVMLKYWSAVLSKVRKPKKIAYQPKSEDRSFYGYCGIKNLGCICYMNSMIQQFFHIPTFRYSLLSVDDKQPPNWQDFEGEKVDDNMLHQLIKFMGFLELSERQDYNPREFCFSFKDFAGQPTNVRIQQDSQEFLNLAFDRLESALKNTTQRYLLENVFGGKTCSMMICKSCGNTRKRTEDFYNLSLEVKNQRSIHDGLKKFVTGEIINDFQCESCKQRVDVERKTVLEKLPNMLIVHLQRIFFDFETMHNQKLNSRVEFPNVLNLREYMLDEIMKQDKQLQKSLSKQKSKQDQQNAMRVVVEAKIEDGKDEDDDNNDLEKGGNAGGNDEDQVSQDNSEEEDVEMNEEIPDANFEYKLVGVVVHMGTADAGHYISYININRGTKPEDSPEWLLTEKDKWLEFNDSTVKDYRFTNLEEDCFGGGSSSGDFKSDYSKNAYMLIYEKRVKELIKLVVPQESAIQQTLDCDSTAISRGADQNMMSNPIRYDEERKEHYTLVNFNSVEKFVPNNIYKLVHEDNSQFLLERQIFTKSYFDTTKNLTNIFLNQLFQSLEELDEQVIQQIYGFMDKLVFDILPYAAENKTLFPMLSQFLSLLEKAPPSFTYELIQNRILEDKSKLQKDQKTFFENLVSSFDQEVRESCAYLLNYVTNKLFKLDDQEKIDLIMNQVFALFPDEASKNWMKLYQLMNFLMEFLRSGQKQMAYMIEHNLISKLIDFFLENESPVITQNKNSKKRQQMGSNYQKPPLENVILCISWICRHQEFIQIDNPDDENYNNNRVSVFYMRTLQHDEPFKLPPLSKEDLEMLQLQAFISKALGTNYEFIEFSRLLGHLSFGNYHFSRKVAKQLIHGLNKVSGDELDPYYQAITYQLLLKDEHTQDRYEWILGIPQLKFLSHSLSEDQHEYKMGVSAIDYISDEITEYRSTLFKIHSQMKESFLQFLYFSRRKWAKYCLQGINALLMACQQDTSGKLYHYIKTLDPPTYQYARYIDWIQLYLNDHLETCMKNSGVQSYQQELLMTTSLLQILNSLKNMFDSVGQYYQDDNKVIKHDHMMDGGPEPYIIYSVVQERVYPMQEHIQISGLWDEGVEVILREFQVKVTESEPNGQTNQKIPSSIFESRSPNNRYKNDNGWGLNDESDNYQKPLKGRGRAYGRGQTQSQWNQQNLTAGSTVFSRRQKLAKGRRAKGKKIVTTNERKGNTTTALENGTDQDFDFSNQDQDHAIYDEDAGAGDYEEYQDDGYDRYNDAYNNNKEDSMEVEYQDDNQDEGNQYYDPQEKVAVDYSQHTNSKSDNLHDHGTVPSFYPADPQTIDVNPQSQNQDRPAAAVDLKIIENNQREEEDVKIEDEVAQLDLKIDANDADQKEVAASAGNNQDTAQAVNPEQLAWAVMVVEIVNHVDKKVQKVYLDFNDLSFGGSPLNFRIPKTKDLKFQVPRGKTSEALIFTKLRPFEDWGNFTFGARIDHEENQAEVQNVSQAVPYFGENQDVQIHNTPQYDNYDFQSGVGGYNNQNDMMMGEDKACSACTFMNSAFLSHCEICGTLL